MKKLFILLAAVILLTNCAGPVALLGPATGVTNGKLVQSSAKSVVSLGIKKQTGKTPMQHALAYATTMNPNKKKERCISFIEKTNSEACMIAKKQISLVQSAISTKISNTQIKIEKNTKTVLAKPTQAKSEAHNLVKTKKSTKELFLVLKTKIKEFDERWLDRIEKSSFHQ